MEILPELIKSFEIPEEKALAIKIDLECFLADLSEYESKADNLIIADIDDKDSMQFARESRLFLKNSRLKIQKVFEKKRDDLKKKMADDLNEDKFYLKASQKFDEVFKRIESKFEDKEKFAERKEAERKQQLKIQRLEELSPYSEFVPMGIDLAEATEDDYKRLLNGAKAQKKLQDEENQRIENERIEEQKRRDELLRRRELFFNAGFKFYDFQFIYREIKIPWAHIENINTEEFEQLFQRSVNTKNEMDAIELKKQNRASKLISLGMGFERDSYVLNIEDVGIQVFPLINLTELSDDDFAIEYQKIKSFKDNADQVLKEKVLAEANERERIKNIQNERRDKLFSLGLKFNGTCFVYEDINIFWVDVLEWSDIEFENIFAQVKNRKDQIDNINARFEYRKEILYNHGLKINGNSFDYKDQLSTSINIIRNFEVDEFTDFEKMILEKIKEIQTKEAAEAEEKIKAELEAKAKKEAEELALMQQNAPDKEKLLEFAQKLDKVVLPAVSSELANKIAFNTQGLIKKTVIYLNTQIQEKL